MSNPHPTAKLDEGYVKIQLANSPGCLARLQAGARRVAWAVGWVAVGFVGGMVWGRWLW
jgi:hypothetical protein